jgi:hypothetical protein
VEAKVEFKKKKIKGTKSVGRSAVIYLFASSKNRIAGHMISSECEAIACPRSLPLNF